jgi:hypothetical protein
VPRHLEASTHAPRRSAISSVTSIFAPDQTIIEDILHDSQCIGAAKEAGALRVAEGYREQLAYVKKMAGAA